MSTCMIFRAAILYDHKFSGANGNCNLPLHYNSQMSPKRRYRLNDDAIRAIKELQRVLRQASGDNPDPDGPLAFDPESDVMQPLAEAIIREMMGDTADAAHLSPDLAYAIRKTGLLVTDRNQDLLDDDQRAAWTEALAEYERLLHHGPN